jgi:putative endopeptidase
MKIRNSFAALLLASTTLGASSLSATGGAAQQAADTAIGIDVNAIDKDVKPGEDFNLYANGNWVKSAEIPADRSSTGVFVQVFNKAEARNAQMIADIAKSARKPGSDETRIADYYDAYLDQPHIDGLGMAPIKPQLETIAAITDKAGLSRALGASMRADVDPMNNTKFWTENLFGLFVSQGLETPDKTMPYILQGGLGMPERDYYLSSDPAMVKTREAYRTYISTLLSAAGIAGAEAKAQAIYALEMKIAQAQSSREESEDWHKANTIWTAADFAQKAPGIDWASYFVAAQLGKQDQFIVWMSQATTNLSALVAQEPLDSWKAWLTFHRINQYAAVLPKAIDDARFAFYGKTLTGAPQQRPRDKRAIAAVNANLGDAVGKIYVGKYFPAQAKADVQDMVSKLLVAFDRRVAALDWMAPATRKEAQRKIETLKVGVGYSETWRDYASLEIKPGDAFGNQWRAGLYEYEHQMAKLGKPVDRGEWWMTPQTVNAVNLPLQNALNFPAAILEAPFYDPHADAAANYGSIGAVIGHEISHSFDNNGAEFDADGRMRNWWTPEDMAHFKAAGKALADQYSAYEPFPGLHLKGDLMLAENIADVAGLSAAYDAYHASLGGKPAPVIDGLTGDQRFFLAFAQSWRTKTREAALRQQVATDGHAPGQYRALTVRNLDGWYKAFGVTQGQTLYLAPDKRVRVW